MNLGKIVLACAVLAASTLATTPSTAQDTGLFPSRPPVDPVAKSDPNAPAPTTSGGVLIGGACAHDAECAGSAVCTHGACAFRDGTPTPQSVQQSSPGQPPNAPAPAAAPPAPTDQAACNADSECPESAVCTNHICQTPATAAPQQATPVPAPATDEVQRLEQERDEVSLGGGITLMAIGAGVAVNAFIAGAIMRAEGYYPESNILYGTGAGGLGVLGLGTGILIAKLNKRKAIRRQIDALKAQQGVSSFSITPEAVVAPGVFAAGFRGTF